MSFIVWQRNYSVGVPSIDVQHKRLVAIINILYDRIRAGNGSAGITGILGELSTYAENHFRHEEFLMGEVLYSGLADQEKSHCTYRARVTELNRSFQKNPNEVLEFLKHWWITHITRSDMLYKDALRGKP